MKFTKYIKIMALLFLWQSCDPKKPVDPVTPEGWVEVDGAFAGLTVQAIASDPDKAGTLYVGTVQGIFKSTNSGKNWQIVNNGLTSLDITSIAVSPPNINVLFCGTWGKGIFRSMDGAGSWQHVWPASQNPLINELSITTADGETVVWAATQKGLFVSTNLGDTWRKPSVFNRVITVSAISKLVLASIHQAGIYRSTDGGLTWSGANRGILHDEWGVEAPLCINFKPDQTSEIFALGDRGSFYRSTDGGESWSEYNPSRFYAPSMVNFKIDSENPQNFWLATQKDGVYYSNDGANTWTKVNHGLDQIQLRSVFLVNNKGTIVYACTVSNGLYKYEK